MPFRFFKGQEPAERAAAAEQARRDEESLAALRGGGLPRHATERLTMGAQGSALWTRERLAIQRIAIREGTDALADEELLDAIRQHPLLRRLMPPAVVH